MTNEPMITWDTLKPSDFKRHKDFEENGLYFAKIEGSNYYIFKHTGRITAWYVRRSLNGKVEMFSFATSKKDAVADLKIESNILVPWLDKNDTQYC